MPNHHTNHHVKHGRRRRSKRLRVTTQPGTPPGTIQAPRGAAASTIRVLAYNDNELTDLEIKDPKQIPALLERWSVVWINVDGLGDTHLIQQVGKVFNIHPLALEDVVNVHQRAKVEPYPDHVFVIVRMPSNSPDQQTEQISLFLGKNFVLTFQEIPGDCFDPIREALRQADSHIRQGCKADYLAYRIVDALVDSYFPVLEHYGDWLDQLDDAITRAPHQHTFNEVHQVKSDLVLLRRSTWPLRDAVRELSQEVVTPYVTDASRVYWRDCFDHTVQVIDLVESYREICADLRDFYLTSISNRMNEIMKLLTVIATIFIPLTFICGVYGMNFDTEISPWNMPELKWYFGYPLCWAVMIAVAATMLIYFWRKGWIGPDRDHPKTGGPGPPRRPE